MEAARTQSPQLINYCQHQKNIHYIFVKTKKKKANKEGMTIGEWIGLILCAAVIVAAGTLFK